MTRCVDQIKHIIFTIICLVVDPNRVRLNGNPAFAFNIHAVEHLLLHVAVLHRPRLLNEAISQGGFPVVNMRHDGEITDFVQLCHEWDMSWFCGLVKVANAPRISTKFGKASRSKHVN